MRIGAKDNPCVDWLRSTQRLRISRVSMTSAPRAPYALEPTGFPFPALAQMAGRAPLGGPREVALACLVVGRLVIEATTGNGVLTEEQKAARLQGARHWLGAAAISLPVRTALGKLAEATQPGDPSAIRTALETVMTVTANHLDPAARLELGRLAQAIAK
jgi:hypothetical protein